MVVVKKTKKKIVKKTNPKKIKAISITKKVAKNILKKSIKVFKNPKKLIKRKNTPKKKKSVLTTKKIVKKEETVKLKRLITNPIIKPSSYSWESKATFNPTAFEHNGKIHILYRAVGEDDSSVLGYAYTQNGLTIEGRPTYHVYKRFFYYNENGPKIDYLSGGGWSGGCEDPRIVLIGDVVYMIFTAFDGWGSVRLALTSINLDDFLNKKWNWKKAVMISPPGEINKNWVLFPERINGKFAIMHSFYPNILIDYFDSLDELDGTKFIKSNNTRPVDKTRGWDSWFRGVGPAPIKTKDGWLVLYHAMDHRNPDRYRLGALLLDLKDPTKVLYRSKSPILEPKEDYENNGHKWGVIYACGAVVKNDKLFVYYGGADKFVCVASIVLNELLDDLKKDKEVKLKKSNKNDII
jgi:predicted GH43/DUF377 family glycosyl hydrolase